MDIESDNRSSNKKSKKKVIYGSNTTTQPYQQLNQSTSESISTPMTSSAMSGLQNQATEVAVDGVTITTEKFKELQKYAEVGTYVSMWCVGYNVYNVYIYSYLYIVYCVYLLSYILTVYLYPRKLN